MGVILQPTETISIALTALNTNKTRSVLTMLGIIIGISSVILLMSIGQGLQTFVTGQFESLGANTLFVLPGKIENNNFGPQRGMATSKFTFGHVNDLMREGQSIKEVMGETETGGEVKYKGKTKQTIIAGVGANYLKIQSQKVTEGSFFSLSQYNSAKKVAVIGKTVAEDLFGNTSPVNKKLTLAGQFYVVSGVLEEKGAFGGIDVDNQVLIPTTTAMRQFSIDHFQTILIQSQTNQTVPQTKLEAERILKRSLKEDEFTVLDTKNILNSVTQVLGFITIALSSIAAISLLVGGVGIMNIMLVSVTERTREIGLRKAVGATPTNILQQFLVEAIALSFLGGLIGVAIGSLGSLALSRVFTTTITLSSILLAFGVSAFVGIVFGVAPAVKAARLNPIEALRHE